MIMRWRTGKIFRNISKIKLVRLVPIEGWVEKEEKRES